MNIKITAYLHYTKYSWDAEGKFELYGVRFDNSHERICISAHEFEIEVPDTFSPKDAIGQAIRKEAERIRKDADEKARKLEERLKEAA